MLRHWKPKRGLTALAFGIVTLTVPPPSSAAQETKIAQAAHQHHRHGAHDQHGAGGASGPAAKKEAPAAKKPRSQRKNLRLRASEVGSNLPTAVIEQSLISTARLRPPPPMSTAAWA